MPQVSYDSKVITHQALRPFCAQLLAAVGIGDEDARRVATMLVEASLRGLDSHGVARLPHYLRRIEAGSIQPRPRITKRRLGPAVALVDGDHGLGHLVMHAAAEEAINVAKEAGTAWVAVRNSSHCGALAHYGLHIADAGMIGFVFSHVDPLVVPYGSKQAFCGTNPICITAPRTVSCAEGELAAALCLDMATSKVPWNTIVNAAIEGVPVPAGWSVDEDGHDTTDANSVAALYPFGGYKGSGLGLMIDVLCAMLSGAPYGPDIPAMYGDLSQQRRLGGLVGAIDIGRFVPVEHFFARLTELVERWSDLQPCDPASPVRYPGEPEVLRRQQRLRDGIPVGLRLAEEFDALADAYQLERLPSACVTPKPDAVN